MRLRTNYDGGEAFPGANCDPQYGELVILNWASAAGPSSEVIDNAAGSVVVGESFGVTLDASAGTLTIDRPGLYLIELLGTCSADGACEPEFALQKNTADFSPTIEADVDLGASNAKGVIAVSRLVKLAKGDVIRAEVTVATQVVTVHDAVLRVFQLTDAELTVTV